MTNHWNAFNQWHNVITSYSIHYTKLYDEKQSATEARKELVKAQLKLESASRLEADLDQVYKTLEDERVSRVNAEHQVSALELKLEAEISARKKAEQDLLDFHLV